MSDSTTPSDILDLMDSSTSWREKAAIHIHAGLMSEWHWRTHPLDAANLTVQHVNALAAELARTQSAD